MSCGVLCIIIGVFITIVVVINIISGVRNADIPVLIASCLFLSLGLFTIMTGNEMIRQQAAQDHVREIMLEMALEDKCTTEDDTEKEDKYTTEDATEKEVLELADNEGVQIFINGEPVSENFDINGIDLDDYEINISGNKVYLMNP